MRTLLSVFSLIFVLIAMPSYATRPNTIQSTVNNNYGASIYDFNAMPINQLIDKIGMRFFNSPNFTVIQWTLKKGAKLPSHSHVNEQVIRVISGKLKVESEGKTYNLLPGQIMVFPSYVSHGFIAMEDTEMYEQQTPIRQDFLEPDFIQKLSDYLAKNQ